MHIAILEEGSRIQLPSEWVAEIGLSDKAELERVAGGIFVYSPVRSSWDELFCTKLYVSAPDTPIAELELSNDDCFC